ERPPPVYGYVITGFVLRTSFVIGGSLVEHSSFPQPVGRSSLPRAWVVVGLLWAVATLNYLDRQLVANMGEPIKADLEIANARFGLFQSVFLWVYGFCSPFAGYLADRVGRKPVIISSLAIWSVATLGTGYVTEYWQMLVARAALGVSEAFYMPAAVALIVDYHAGRTRSRAT